MAEANWYVVHTYSGYENKVKANIDKTIENRHLEDQILEVRVPMEDVVEVKNGVKKQVSKKMFPGYVLIHMIMNDDTWYVVRNTRGVTGFVGPGSKPVPLTDVEMRNLGIKSETVVVDFAEGDMIVVIGGVWKDTCGVITNMNNNKQTVTINVELFGRETPVEVSFADVKKMNKGGNSKWQRKLQDILNCRFLLVKQLQHHQLVQLLVSMVLTSWDSVKNSMKEQHSR